MFWDVVNDYSCFHTVDNDYFKMKRFEQSRSKANQFNFQVIKKNEGMKFFLSTLHNLIWYFKLKISCQI